MKRSPWLVTGAALAIAVAAAAQFCRDDARQNEPAAGSPPGLIKDAPASERMSNAPPNVPVIRVSPATGGEGEGMHLAGRVVERGTGEGIDGAELTFEGGGGGHAVLSGEGGAFRFEPAEPGRYRLVVIAAEGYVPFAPLWGESPLVFAAQRGRHIEDVELSLEAEVAISGRVESNDGTPVSGAAIQIRVAAGEAAVAPKSSDLESDDEGRFELRAPVGTLLDASHPDYGMARRPLMPRDVQAGEIVLMLRTEEAMGSQDSISGRVLDQDDAPVAGAHVMATRARQMPWADPWFWATTDLEGRFEITAVPSGSFTLLATAPEHVPAEKAGLGPGAEDIVLRIRRDGGFIAGTVRAETAEQVPGFTLLVSEPLGAIEERAITTQSFFDAGGSFQIGPLEPGNYVVSAVADGFATSDRYEVAVREGQTMDLTIEVAVGGRITGRTVEAASGQPIAGAAVRLEGMGAHRSLPIPIERSATTGEAGRFELSGIAPGLASVEASKAGYNPRIVSALEIEDGDTTGPIEIALSPVAEGELPSPEFEGIGAALSAQEDALVIGNLVEGGGAEAAELAVGDTILAIDGARVGDLDMNSAIQRIRGPVGTTVTLRIEGQDGEARDVEVPRRRLGGKHEPSSGE